MRASYVLGLAYLSGSHASVQPSPSVAADPTITAAPSIPIELLRQRQNNDRFMGWISASGEWTSRTCDIGGTFYQTDDVWRCCATTQAGCNVPVGCISGSLIYQYNTGSALSRSTIDCTDAYEDAASFTVCNTGFLYENTLDSRPKTNVFCGKSSLNWSYYRNKPEEPSSASPSESSDSASTPASTPAMPTSAMPTSPDPTFLPIVSSTPLPAPKKKSQAWIAGAVVGPIVGLALIGAIIFFFLRRKKNTAGSTAPQAPLMEQTQQPYPGSPQPYSGSPQPPPAVGFYAPANNQSGSVPYGVGTNEQKHASYVQPLPMSPNSHDSASPQMTKAAYMSGQQPAQPQQWTPVQQPNSPQMLSSELPAEYVPTNSYMGGEANRPNVQTGFSNELDGTPHQSPAVPVGQK